MQYADDRVVVESRGAEADKWKIRLRTGLAFVRGAGVSKVGSKVPVGVRSEEFFKETSVYRSGDGMLVNCRGNRNARDG